MIKVNIDQVKLADLVKNLQQLTPKLEKSVFTSAIRIGAKTLQQDAISYAPISTGTLRESIKIQKMKKSETPTNTIAFKIGIDNNICWYANIVEFGSSKSTADPFMTPAYENNGRSAIDEMKKYLIMRTNKEIAKGAR